MIWALIILALWAALLAPGVVRWIRHHQPTTSIASFHRQLRGLEHTGPKIVEPAYRLDGEEEAATEREARPRPSSVPRLVLVTSGPTDKESTMRYDDRYVDPHDDGYDDDAPWDEPWRSEDAAFEPVVRARTVRAPRYDEFDEFDEFDDEIPATPRGRHARADRHDDVRYARRGSVDVTVGLPPERAGMRRRRILVGLGIAIAATFILGLLPGLGLLWAGTFLVILAAVGYLGLMLYASNTGLYGAASESYDTSLTPVARVVMPTFGDDAYDQFDDEYDEDDWGHGQVAAAR